MEQLNRFSGAHHDNSSHRLSTVKNAEQIVVLDKEFIMEQGTQQELTNCNGDYYQLVKN